MSSVPFAFWDTEWKARRNNRPITGIVDLHIITVEDKVAPPKASSLLPITKTARLYFDIMQYALFQLLSGLK